MTTVSSTATGYAGLSWPCFAASLCHPVDLYQRRGGGVGAGRRTDRDSPAVSNRYIYSSFAIRNLSFGAPSPQLQVSQT